MTYVNQAQYELMTGCAEVAIEYLDFAVALNPEDELPYIVRSKCLNRWRTVLKALTSSNCVLRLERPKEAIIDANKALEFNPYSTKAILAKGEALYNMGLFENALMQFQRGWKFRADPAIKIGMTKCRDVILNTLGDPNKEYDKGIVEKVIKEMEDSKLENNPKPKKKISERKEQVKSKDKFDNGKLLLGKMNEDVKFLQNFIDFQKSQTTKSKYTVRHRLFY